VPKSEPAQELERLRKELKRVTMERDILGGECLFARALNRAGVRQRIEESGADGTMLEDL
jgi:transposase-like protein